MNPVGRSTAGLFSRPLGRWFSTKFSDEARGYFAPRVEDRPTVAVAGHSEACGPPAEGRRRSIRSGGKVRSEVRSPLCEPSKTSNNRERSERNRSKTGRFVLKGSQHGKSVHRRQYYTRLISSTHFVVLGPHPRRFHPISKLGPKPVVPVYTW